MKRMLFNATQAEELRVAIVDGQKLIDLDIESASKEQRKSNIYKAIITRIEPSLEAAFVNYGSERHGFLPFKEVSRAYFKQGIDAGKARIQDALTVGQELIVQVEKDERGNKGAALTTFISLAGRYLVLMPNNPRGGGVSRRIEGEDRQELREVMDQLEAPPGASLIARTAGIGRTHEELQWDLNYLAQLWSAIDGAAKSQSGAFLIYQESSLVIRAIRDYFHPEIGEILIDTDDIFEQAQQFMSHVMPGNLARVKRYRDDVPLFSRFQIEHQIESAYSRQVNLPSGGAVVIDHTEALVAVDVNSGRATKGSDIEETAFKTNLEAAEEVARQLRLRDLGGLIVIDFIDMESSKNQREVENRLRDALHFDRARVQTGKISRFGLLELSRQRLRPALAETSYITCPRCTGTGHIRSTESAALHILRIIEEEAMKENTGALHIQVPVDVGTFLLNEKRVDIAHIEVRHRVNLVIVPNRNMETPQHDIARFRHDQLNVEDGATPSYQMAEKAEKSTEIETYRSPSIQKETHKQEAAVKGITPESPAPIVESLQKNAKPGFFASILAFFKGSSSSQSTPASRKSAGRKDRGDENRRSGREKRPERPASRDTASRQDRPPRTGQQPKRNEQKPADPQPQKENRNRNQPRQRGESKNREPVLVTETQPISATPPAPEAQQRESRSGRNSRRGRGRGRNSGGTDEQSITEPVTQSELVFAAENTPVEIVPAEITPATKPIPEIVALPVAQIAPPTPTSPSAAPVEVLSLQQVGLVMIETQKQTVTPSIEPTPPTLGRKPKQAAVPNAEPMQMVETRPTLS